MDLSSFDAVRVRRLAATGLAFAAVAACASLVAACGGLAAASARSGAVRAPVAAVRPHATRGPLLPALSLVPSSAFGAPVDPRISAGDWRHAWQVVGLLRAQPPRSPVVLYFGDSTARESLVSEASWTRQLRRMGAPRVRAFALAGHGQTFAMDQRLLDALPPLHGLALIGVSLSRFAGPPVEGPAGRPAAFPLGARLKLSPWRQHLYDSVPVMTPVEKVERVAHWRRSVTPRFVRYRSANLRALARLVSSCEARGLRPVLIELPLNVAAVGDALDAQRSSITRGCRAVAARLGARFLAFQIDPRLPDSAFHDTCHLVRAGYTRWQRDLSRRVVRLLRSPG